MRDWIEQPQIDCIMWAKSQIPDFWGWKIVTIETEGGIILDIDYWDFECYSIDQRLVIARVTNELCNKIRETGVPCFIQKTTNTESSGYQSGELTEN